jgi:hypothetical protein
MSLQWKAEFFEVSHPLLWPEGLQTLKRGPEMAMIKQIDLKFKKKSFVTPNAKKSCLDFQLLAFSLASLSLLLSARLMS